MKRFLSILALAVWACDAGTAPQLTEPLSETALFEHLNFLAGDSLYGRGSGTEYEREAAEYVRDQFSEYGLAPGVDGYLQDFSVQVRSDSAPLTSQNVLAVLPGHGDLAGQWVILGAHYDHLGYTAEDSIVIYNGADDNASGTSLVLEIARYLQHHFIAGSGEGQDRRSLMFQAYGAEERGLLGSLHFVSHPTVPMDSIVAMVNLDMVGRMEANVLNVGGASTASVLDNLLEAANGDDLLIYHSDRGLSRSDQYYFLQAGTPILYLTTGLSAGYHTPEDDVWRINGEGMLKVGDLVVGVLLNLVALSERPEFAWP